jgi:hypothetical protein
VVLKFGFMKKKILFFLLVGIYLVFGCNDTKSRRTPTVDKRVVMKAFDLGTYDLTEGDSMLYTLVEIDITNSTDTEVKFIGYSCATAGNIVVNLNNITICPNRCPQNVPQRIVIRPGQTFSLPAILCFDQRKYYSFNPAPLKIGFVLVPPDLFDGHNLNALLTQFKANNENIIWGDLIDSTNSPYEIK